MDTEDVAGVAGLPEASNINVCDGSETKNRPAESAGNPIRCRTLDPGYVYFIAASKHVKIGFSTAPIERLQALQTSHPEKLEILHTVSGDQRMERRLHQRFAGYRVRGEWFRLSNEISHYIDHLKNPRKVPEQPPAKAKVKKKEPASPEVVRLHKLREECGAKTPRGHLISNVLEGMERLPTWERQSWVCDERQTPHYWLNKNVARLGG
jgi:hypothetical protein